jgi:hypothetical protein
MTIQEINNRFNIQIAKGQDEIHKQLFNLTKDFTTSDWRKIRDKGYWEEVGLMNSIQRKEVTLQRVIKYINTPSY